LTELSAAILNPAASVGVKNPGFHSDDVSFLNRPAFAVPAGPAVSQLPSNRPNFAAFAGIRFNVIKIMTPYSLILLQIFRIEWPKTLIDEEKTDGEKVRVSDI
jgi:hypothetical protein